MGIPSFYRWLVHRYPLAVTDVIEEVPPAVNGVSVPIDTSIPNPNGMEFDNLYLDMNGIIHPCFHPDDQPAFKTYEEIFKNVFKYIDRIFSIIRPRKLLYMAVDGVAPRAKMNQQRARRFRAAKDAADIAAEAAAAGGLSSALKRELASLDELEQTKTLDSNVITPGTEFMALLSSALQYYIHLRTNTDPGWRGIKVILSDANVPGEGEHKIMSYIRLQRNLPGFDPNTRHCLYGLDADLIMLALATHEVHFSILREDVYKMRVKDKKPTSRQWSSQTGRERHLKKLTQSNVDSLSVNDDISMVQFQFLNIWILRDYLAHEMRISDKTVKADFERLIDDFVFMCLFVGNDFLPHVPSLEISEGAIDLLMTVYKKEFVRMGGYLTDSSEVNLECVERFLQAVGSHESAIFRKRSQTQMENKKRGRSIDSSTPHAKRLKNSESLCSSSKIDEKKTLISISKELSHDVNTVVDKVKLGEKGWKERYYAEKFEAKTKDDQERIHSHAVLKYIEGICWVMHYYYRGVCSWKWFYPYHYAPFASDFYGLGKLEIRFTLGEPFKPINQLMSVLPAASAHALPLFYRVLMTDSSSPISDFYPTDFELDMNGKQFEWQAVIKLPFIMESRLLVETAKVEHTLTEEEKRRNILGMDILFVHISHPLKEKIFSLREQKKTCPELPNAEVEHKLDPTLSNGMNGYIYISDKPVLPPEIYSPIVDMEMITNNETISVFYKYPPFHPHIPRLPQGVLMPVKSIRSSQVLSAPMLWHEKLAVFGRRFSERPIPKSISGPCLSKLARRLVSEYYLMKQRQPVGSTESKGHVTADGSVCHPMSLDTVCQKESDHVRQSCMSGSETRKRKWPTREKGPVGSTVLNDHVTTYCSSHQPNFKETDQGEGSCINESRPQETNVLVSKSCPTKQQQVMGPANTAGLVCQPNSKETVFEKGPDHVSCINGSKPRKKKEVKKHQSSIANKLQSESFPMKQQRSMGFTELNGHLTTCQSTSQPNLNETVDEQERDNGGKSSINVNAAIDYSTCHLNAEEAVCEKGPEHSEQSCSLGKEVVSGKGPDHGEQSCMNGTKAREKGRVKKCRSSITNDPVSESFSGYKPNSKVVSGKGPDPGEERCMNGTEAQEKRRVKKHRSSITIGPVSESCLLKKSGIVSTDFNGHVTTDCIPCQPNSKETGDKIKPDNGEQSRINIDVTTNRLCHHTLEETVCEKVRNHGEQSGINAPVSKTSCTKPQQAVGSGEPKETDGEKELDHNGQNRTNVDFTIDWPMHLPNSEGTVREKGPDHAERSCLNRSESWKRKWVKKKRQDSIATGSESCPIGHQVVMGSAEVNGHVSTGHSISQLSSKERVHAKELNHRGASSINLSRSQRKNQRKNRAKKRFKERQRLQSQESEAARTPNPMAAGLVSESCPIGHQVVMGSAELNRLPSETCRSNPKERAGEKELDHSGQSGTNVDFTIDWSMHLPNSEGTVREKGPDHGEQSCLNGSESRKRKWVKKKHQDSIATGSESCPIGHQVVMGSAEVNGHVSAGGSASQLNSKGTVHEKYLNHGEASSIKLSKSQRKNRSRKRAKECQRLQSQESEAARSL